MRLLKGMCSAASRARLISSMASMRRDFSGCSTLTAGAPARPISRSGNSGACIENGCERVGPEPVGQLGDVLAAGVVEVLAGGKDLHRLRTGTGGEFQQPGMQALVKKQMRRQDAQHGQGNPPRRDWYERQAGRCFDCLTSGNLEQGSVARDWRLDFGGMSLIRNRGASWRI